MFGGRSRYYEAPEPDSRRFCWNVEPTFTCPLAWFERADDANRSRIPSAAVVAAAGTLGCGAAELARLLERQHASRGVQRRRVDGRLTDTCDCCGGRMERKGFRCWAERVKTEEEMTESDRVSAAIGKRLGGSGDRTVVLRSFYVDTKREAKQWALEELRAAQAAAV